MSSHALTIFGPGFGIDCRRAELPGGREVFGVSAASAVKSSQRLRQTGSATAKAMGGARRAVLAGERDWLRARIKVAPDLTLRALAAELAERGVVVSHWAVWKFCQDEALTFKKKHSAKRAGSLAARQLRWPVVLPHPRMLPEH